MPVRVAIADDHPMVINGLQKMLADYPHMEITGCYGNGDTLLEDLARELPDVLLLDIQMPGKTGDELAPLLLRLYPGLKILTLTNFDSPLYISNMLRHGVHGYLLKTTEKEVLVAAIEAVHSGGHFLDPALEEKMNQHTSRMKRAPTTKIKLTSREKEILRLIINGDTDPEIAQKLFLSLYTVKNYRINMLLKLDAKNTAALVGKALKLGLVE